MWDYQQRNYVSIWARSTYFTLFGSCVHCGMLGPSYVSYKHCHVTALFSFVTTNIITILFQQWVSDITIMKIHPHPDKRSSLAKGCQHYPHPDKRDFGAGSRTGRVAWRIWIPISRADHFDGSVEKKTFIMLDHFDGSVEKYLHIV